MRNKLGEKKPVDDDNDSGDRFAPAANRFQAPPPPNYTQAPPHPQPAPVPQPALQPQPSPAQPAPAADPAKPLTAAEKRALRQAERAKEQVAKYSCADVNDPLSLLPPQLADAAAVDPVSSAAAVRSYPTMSLSSSLLGVPAAPASTDPRATLGDQGERRVGAVPCPDERRAPCQLPRLPLKSRPP